MKITNKLNLPAPFVDACSVREPVPGTYTATELLKGVREIILNRRHSGEIERDASEMVWAVFGSAVHSVLEAHAERPEEIKETRLAVDCGGATVSGQFDLYDAATGTVTDYKTASVWRVIYDDWGEYREQLMTYCWLLEQSGFPASRGRIIALLKDHSKTKAERERGYPPYPVYVKEFAFTDEDLRAVGERIADKVAEIKRAEALPDDDLPLCSDGERWHRPGKFAVMKQGRKKALKLYGERTDAEIHALEVGGYVEERPGKDGKCDGGYCQCREFCSYWRAKEAR